MPETLKLQETDLEKLWKRMYSGMHYLNCMISIGTAEIANEEEYGLCSNHAYGILKTVECGSERMVLIKNPWGRFTWKGKYSRSSPLWTEQLKQACEYDASYKQDGVFWMDFMSMVKFFEIISLNWNPQLLQYKKQNIGCWKSLNFPQDDEVDATGNPQYMIRFNSGGQINSDIICWVIFSTLENNSDDDDGFQAIHVFLQNNCNQIPILSMPDIKGVYSNRKSNLTYLTFPQGQILQQGTIVKLMLSESKRKSDLNYM